MEEKEYPYLYLDATYLKVRWGASVTSMALLACVGVDEEGFTAIVITIEPICHTAMAKYPQVACLKKAPGQ